MLVILLNLTILVTVLLKLARKEIIVAIRDQTSWHVFWCHSYKNGFWEKFLFHAMFTDGFVNNGD